MSLIELIFGQKIILLTIGVAVLLIMAALALAIIPRIRKSRAEAAQRRAEERAEKAMIAAEMAAQAQEEAERATVTSTKRRRKSAKAVPVSETAPLKSAPPAVVTAPVPAAKPPVAVASPEPTQAPQAGQPPTADMQDILSSVFADDDATERQASLLRGMSDVDMSNLLTLGQQVIVQMRGGKTVTVVGSKELE
jgi:type II secretory pathway pseudopilin PulG